MLTNMEMAASKTPEVTMTICMTSPEPIARYHHGCLTYSPAEAEAVTGNCGTCVHVCSKWFVAVKQSCMQDNTGAARAMQQAIELISDHAYFAASLGRLLNRIPEEQAEILRVSPQKFGCMSTGIGRDVSLLQTTHA